MKKSTLFIALLALSSSVIAQKTNTFITGKIEKLPAKEWIYLSSFGSSFRDSTQQSKEGFKFSLNIPDGDGGFYILSTGKNSYQVDGGSLFLFLEKGKMKISSPTENFKDAKFNGGNLATYYNLYNNRPQVKGTKELYKQLEIAQNNKDTEKINTIYKNIEATRTEQKELDKIFVGKHKNSSVVAYPLFFNLRSQNNWSELEEVLNNVSPGAKNNQPVKQIIHSINTDKLTGVGRTALPFTQNDVNGKAISLADFRGKYVLIDFWASWCVPCRVENPHVVSAFQQFKNQNFTVLGVSFDNPGQHGRWTQAIKDDNLTWTQVSDLKGWKNEVGVLYDIRSIPSNLLIDPNGIIIAKNLKGDKLKYKLEELLGQPKMDKETFVIKGKVENAKNYSLVQITYEDESGARKTDSTRIFNGVFSYIGKTKQPVSAYATFKNENQAASQSFENYFTFFIEPGIIEVSGNTDFPKDALVKGTKNNNLNIEFTNLTKEEHAALAPLSKSYNEKSMAYGKAKQAGESEETVKKLYEEANNERAKMTPYYDAMLAKQMAYMKANPNSFLTANQLRYRVSSTPLNEIQEIYAQMDDDIKNTSAGKELAKEIANIVSGSPGSIAVDFVDTDINGKTLKLSDFKGKYVLLDFWASWCVPCRQGNPHLLSLYAKYKSKGFEIIGVSDDDRNHEAWKKAVNQDKIHVWKHVLRGLKSDEKGGYDRSEDKSENYGIHTLPTKILIDPKGVIIGRYGSGGGNDADMDSKLKEIFKF